MIANNFKQNELNEFAETQALRHDASFGTCCDEHAPVGSYGRNVKRSNRAVGDVSRKCVDGDEWESEAVSGEDASSKPIYSRRSSRASINKMALQRQRSGDRLLDGTNTAQTPNSKAEVTCTECGSRTPATKKRRPTSQRDLRHKRTKSGLNRAPAACVTVSPEQEVAIYGFPKQLTQSAPDLTNMPVPQPVWAISPDEVYAVSPYSFPPPPTSVQSTPYRVAAYPQEPEVKRATIGAPRSARRMLNYTFDQYENV